MKATEGPEGQERHVKYSMDQLNALRTTALSGAATAALGLGLTHNATLGEWTSAASAPTLWPVMGPITGAFGERIDPFNGEGAFHSGVDISAIMASQLWHLPTDRDLRRLL